MRKMTFWELMSALRQQFPERDEAIYGMCAALLSKEHALLIGPPGTAKSLLSRILAAAADRKYFETLMHAFGVPDEVFGGLSMKGIQNDEFRRNTTNFLPEAEIGFLDEVFKSNTGVLNTLLMLMNERKYSNDGKTVDSPLMTVFGASNELQEGPALDALFDRFMVRLTVHYVQDRDAFKRMLVTDRIEVPGKVDLKAEQSAAEAIKVTPETVDAMVDMRYAFMSKGRTPSDRRWRNSLKLIRAAAHLRNSDKTAPDDLEVLEHVLWNKPDEKVEVSKIIQSVICPDGAIATELLDSARETFRKIPDPANVDASQFMAQIGNATQDLKGIFSKLEGLPKSRKVAVALDEVRSLKDKAGKLAMKAAGIDI